MGIVRDIRAHCYERRELGVGFRSIEIEARSQDESDGMTLRGVAAVFDKPSEVLFGAFVERIKRGAFTNVLRTNPDVRFLINHDGVPLARTTNGTLRLSETPRGLEFEADIADTTLGRDLHTLVARGDITQMSFAFTVSEDEWRYSNTDEPDERVIRAIGELFEISAVTMPAYTQTSVQKDSLQPEGEQRDQADDAEQVEQAHTDTSSAVSTSKATAIRAWLAINS